MNPVCECGCGEPTRIAPQTDRSRGWVKGKPIRFRRGHNRRRGAEDYVVDANGCWVWQRAKNAAGYGVTKRLGRTTGAHAWSWEQRNGPVPAGFELDHTCHNRACINPDHLEVVTHAENMNRRTNA